MRAVPVLLLAVGLVASLSSCATAPFSDSCHSTVTSGDASNVVTATGAFGSPPTVSFPTPIISHGMERTELLPGTGPVVGDGDVLLIKFTSVNGSTENVEGQTDYAKPGSLVTLGTKTPAALTVALQCAQVGSRVAITTDAAGVGADSSQTTDSYVLVVDIMKGFPGKAYGAPQIAQAGMPSVVTAESGAPGITILKTPPPAEFKINVLREADGEVVEAGDRVVVKYTGVLWEDSSVFDSTWTDGKAQVVTLTASDKVTKGFVKGLVGQRVGSQVLIVAPPEYGFGDAGSMGVPAGSTLVYVVDILGDFR